MRTLRSENENLRIQKLHEYCILDTPPEQAFDDIVSLAAQICCTPFALITLVDSDREWFKAKKGIAANENPRSNGFCAHTILHQDVMVISNADNDNRFSTNPLITSEPNIRFYAGAPVRTPTGEALGTVCVLDTIPRELSEEQLEALRSLARQVGIALELRRKEISAADTCIQAKHTKPYADSLLDALSKQYCVLDESGNVLAVNKPWLDFEHEYGGNTQTLEIGQNYLRLLDTGLTNNRGGDAFAEGIRSVLNGTKSSFSLEYSYNTPSEQKWFVGKVVPLPEQPGSVLVIHENISGYKRLERRFRQAVESTSNAIVMINESGMILLVNLQTEIFFGYSRTELVGQPIEMLVPERFRSAHVGFRQAYLAAPVSTGRDLYGLRKDGTEFPVEIGLSFINDESGIIVLSSLVDITERKNANDNLKNALNEKEMLLKEVYHRVKNNLQVVSSLINLQAQNIHNQTAANLLKQSADRIKSMALLHEKLYQSKDLTRINFNEYIRSLVDYLLYGYGAYPDKINLSLKIDDVFLNVDTAIPCGLIINELLSNALEHAFPGDRHGEISISFTQDQGEFILVIADNGIGFPTDLDFKKSASLGLQLVATLTSQLMGHMTLDQANGSTFSLRFTNAL